MLKITLLAVLGTFCLARGAAAQSCPAYTYALTNGQTADANQVMSNFNSILNCANSNLAPVTSPSFKGYVGIGTATPADALDTSSGIVRANGFRTRAGQGGSAGYNVFNLYWTGSGVQLWVDTVDIGQIGVTSDRRLKQQIEPAAAALPRVMQLRPVTFRWRDVGIFRDDGVRHEGFIADEVQTVIPAQ